MSAQNQVTLIGRLTKDPEVEEVGKDKKYLRAKLSLAIKNLKKKMVTNNEVDADFIDGLVAWNAQAKFAEQYLSRGRMVLIHGELSPERWKDNEDKNQYKLTVKVNSLEALDSKRN